MTLRLPIRVFRLSKLDNSYAPPPLDGKISYRYDGLYFARSAEDSSGSSLNTQAEACPNVLIGQGDVILFLLERISNISFHSNIVFMQKLGLIYDTYMSMLGFRQDLYDNKITVKASAKKNPPAKKQEHVLYHRTTNPKMFVQLA